MKFAIRKKTLLWAGSILALSAVIVLFVSASRKMEALATEVTLQNHPYDVSVLTRSRQTATGETLTVRIEVRENGELVDLLSRQSLIHATLVSGSLEDTQLYNATETLPRLRPGVYEFTHNLIDSKYDLWVEINNNNSRDHHGDMADYRAHASITSPNNSPLPAASPRAEITLGGGEYTMKLLGDASATAGATKRFQIQIEQAGQSAKLLDTEHFYFIASSDEQIYQLSHVDHAGGSENEGVVSTFPLILKNPGRYALWVQVYTADTVGFRDKIINAPLIFEVE